MCLGGGEPVPHILLVALSATVPVDLLKCVQLTGESEIVEFATIIQVLAVQIVRLMGISGIRMLLIKFSLNHQLLSARLFLNAVLLAKNQVSSLRKVELYLKWNYK